MNKTILCFALLTLQVATLDCGPLPDEFKEIYTEAESYLINENHNAALSEVRIHENSKCQH